MEPPDLHPSEDPVWTGTAVNRGALLVAAALVIPALVPMTQRSGRVMPVAALLAVAPLVVATMLFSSVRVVVGPQEVVAGLGPWGWPRRRYPMARVRSALADVIEPIERGGWGYRVGRYGPSIIVRRGEALVLNLYGGDEFTVTVDGAADAAMVVNSYLPGR